VMLVVGDEDGRHGFLVRSRTACFMGSPER
jgi:hypothetical protein